MAMIQYSKTVNRLNINKKSLTISEAVPSKALVCQKITQERASNIRSRGEVNNNFNSDDVKINITPVIPCKSGDHNIHYKTKSGLSIMKTKELTSLPGPDIMLNRKTLYKKEMAKWLEKLPWDYFGTLTVGYKMSLERWEYRMKVYHEKLTYQEQNAHIFWVAEKFKSGDNFHIHALIRSKLPANVLWEIWQMITGIKDQKGSNRAQIVKRNPKKLAGAYVMKDIGYSVKELFDYSYDYLM